MISENSTALIITIQSLENKLTRPSSIHRLLEISFSTPATFPIVVDGNLTQIRTGHVQKKVRIIES